MKLCVSPEYGTNRSVYFIQYNGFTSKFIQSIELSDAAILKWKITVKHRCDGSARCEWHTHKEREREEGECKWKTVCQAKQKRMRENRVCSAHGKYKLFLQEKTHGQRVMQIHFLLLLLLLFHTVTFVYIRFLHICIYVRIRIWR